MAERTTERRILRIGHMAIHSNSTDEELIPLWCDGPSGPVMVTRKWIHSANPEPGDFITVSEHGVAIRKSSHGR